MSTKESMINLLADYLKLFLVSTWGMVRIQMLI
ncbi:unnamed protein product [Trichobilharzia regenti]|nr:unnamed protein product [Trichobilharzia regenti]